MLCECEMEYEYAEYEYAEYLMGWRAVANTHGHRQPEANAV